MRWRYLTPSPFEPVARYSDPQGNRRAWPWPFASERLGALQASSIGCIRFDITRSHRSCGRGGGTRTPVDAVLETAALAAELHLFRKLPNKKSRLGRSRAACQSGACRQSFQDIDKRTSPPVKAQDIAPRSQYWLRFLASDGLCITIIMGPSFYARRCAKSI
jgi:hypothetical protein